MNNKEMIEALTILRMKLSKLANTVDNLDSSQDHQIRVLKSRLNDLIESYKDEG